MYKWNSTQDTRGNWVENKKVVAKLIPKGEIRGLLKQDVIVGPDEAIVLIRNGRIEDIANQTRIKSVGGGFNNWLSSKLSVGENLDLMFVNLRPIDLKIDVKGTTKDYVDVGGEGTFRFQIDVNGAAKLLSMLNIKTSTKETGLIFKSKTVEESAFLTEDDLINKFKSEMNVKVFSPHISAHTADDFRGNQQMTKDMETAIITQMNKTLSLFGMNALDLFVNWQGTEFDAVMKERKRIQLQDSLRESQHLQQINEVSRSWELQKASVAGEEGLATQRTRAQIERDRIAHENEVLKAKDRIALEREEDDSDMETLNKLTDIKAKMNEQKIREYQETELKRRSIELDVDKERVRGDVERSKYNIDTMERTQDRERQFHRDQIDDMSKLTHAAKQNVPNTVVSGGATPVIGIDAGGGVQPTKTCECGEPLKPKWKVCPSCGAKVE